MANEIKEWIELLLMVVTLAGTVLSVMQVMHWGNLNKVKTAQVELEQARTQIENIVRQMNQIQKTNGAFTNADLKRLAIEKAQELTGLPAELLDTEIEAIINKIKDNLKT